MESTSKKRSAALDLGRQSQGAEHALKSEITHGNLVALEGDDAIIDTQLRLLPPSSKILILPSFEISLPNRTNAPFDARVFVRDVHQTFQARCDTARAFLQASTSSQPRLAFMNGGCVGARTACIARISETMTDGNFEAAQTIFEEIIKDGVAGLGEEPEEYDAKVSEEASDIKATEEEEPQHPCCIAMQAAESLDRETACLEPETDDKVGDASNLGPKINTEIVDALPPGSMIPVRRSFTNECGEIIEETVIMVPGRKTSLSEKRSTFGAQTPYTPDEILAEGGSENPNTEEVDGEDDEEVQPGNQRLSIMDAPLIEFGEACMVKIQSPTDDMPSVKRVYSTDCLTQERPRQLSLPANGRSLKHSFSSWDLPIRPVTSDGREVYAGKLAPLFVKASETFIQRSSPRSSNSSSPVSSVFNKHDTDPSEFLVKDIPTLVGITSDEEASPKEPAAPFVPVFEMIEDLIIHISDESDNDILQSVINSYKNGAYSSVPTLDSDAQEKSPSRALHMDVEQGSPYGFESSGMNSDRDMQFDDGASSPEMKKKYPQRKGSKIEHPAMTTTAPLTPATTPPPGQCGVAHKFLEVSAGAHMSAVAIQDSLRALLNSRFPPESSGYRQYFYSTEADRLWKPMFNNDNSQNSGRTVDQIIAVGCEENVNREFFADVAGQIERLGTKKSGVSQSGKLDLQ
jgi:hypothetical protein